MNKLQQIEKIVREKCPELMELSFGCEFSYFEEVEYTGGVIPP